jgi:hypothetical protein
MEKIERDGKVAVLYSPDFGAGWSTWITDAEDKVRAMFCPRLVRAVLKESGEDPELVAKDEFPDEYTGGVEQMEVEWIEKGARFLLDEFDGNESILVLGPTVGYVA